MRKLVVHMQTTLDNRIANDQGVFWEPFPWGQVEQDYINDHYARADAWVMSRPIYEAVVPWWETVARGEVPDDVEGVTEVDREFARLLAGMTKVVISRTIDPAPGREVIDGDIAAHLEKLKAGEGRDVILSCGPATLAPLTATPGLIDEYLVVVHPRPRQRAPAVRWQHHRSRPAPGRIEGLRRRLRRPALRDPREILTS